MNIFCVPWHTGHQHYLFQIGHKFYMMESGARKWAENSRPFPDVQVVPYYMPGIYDVAILNIDQQCVNEDIGKSKFFREISGQIQDIPKIVIQHGSPVYPEWGTKEKIKQATRELVKDAAAVVVNSYEAANQWEGIHENIIPIWHGMNPNDWWDLPKEPRIVTAVSPAGLSKYYSRMLYHETQRMLSGKGIGIIEFRTHVSFKNWDEYRDYLGRSLVYFDYSLHTPMNRARTEAMLSGCCVVTVKGHDVDRFIQNGKNGVLVRYNPSYCANMLEELLTNRYQECVNVGKEGKKTAIELFSFERYKQQWNKLLCDIL